MSEVLRWLVMGIGVLMAAGTAASLSRNPHWLVRGWDFPRIHIGVIAAGSALIYLAVFFAGSLLEAALLLIVGGCAAWQAYKIFPYTWLAPRRVKACAAASKEKSFCLLTSNVQMDNHEFERFRRVVREADPDLVLLLETDDRWLTELGDLKRTHPHTVLQPQDNMYGIALYSRLPLTGGEVRFIIQDDIPSIRSEVELPCGAKFQLYCLHPRPPEPLRDQDSGPRDAELVVVGREIAKSEMPAVIAGDLNDVAWSATSELFLRISGLLDPRMGRGLYNTFNAKTPFLRFPLDHVFHSNCFELISLRRLGSVGSDHFPMLIELCYREAAPKEQPETEERAGDAKQAEHMIDRV